VSVEKNLRFVKNYVINVKKNMPVRITISIGREELTRDYNWEVDGDHMDKGEIVEEMMSVLKESNQHNF